MGTFKRLRRTNVDASPNQFLGAPADGQVYNLVGYHISNAQNAADSWVGFYDNTSGVVTVGTTASDYGRLLIPAQAQVVDRSGSEQNPLMVFTKGVTAFATTTETGSTSPTSDLTLEIFYYT